MYHFMAWCNSLPQKWIYAGPICVNQSLTLSNASPDYTGWHLTNLIKKINIFISDRRATVHSYFCAGPRARVERGQQTSGQCAGSAREKLPGLRGSDWAMESWGPWCQLRGITRRGPDQIWKLSGDGKSESVVVLSFHGKVKVKSRSHPLVGFEFSKCPYKRWPHWR